MSRVEKILIAILVLECLQIGFALIKFFLGGIV